MAPAGVIFGMLAGEVTRDPLAERFKAAGMPVRVVLGAEPHLVVTMPGTSGHCHHGPGRGEHDATVWLGPDVAPMCCCEDWWALRECEHIPAALAVVSEVDEVTWPPARAGS